ncbi:response regulator [Streptomyces sp. CS227]|uniref:response regulator n=1 Tax=Streptomyces sp. CS227 TaxID=1982763 RepID=UPI000B417433|nr:response regulator [Streptomyces sp. CS227]OWA02248.1 response regulator [Streptomyces sp. CS227]
MTDDGRPAARRVDLTRVLVVEDSEEDVEAIERALNRSHPALHLEFTAHGDGLAERLLARREELPGMILLDLNTRGEDGLEGLAALRARPELADLTVVVFTSSTAPADVDACYAAGADSYIYKPVNFDLFRTVLKGAVDYWLQAKAQPPAAPGSPRVK